MNIEQINELTENYEDEIDRKNEEIEILKSRYEFMLNETEKVIQTYKDEIKEIRELNNIM